MIVHIKNNLPYEKTTLTICGNSYSIDKGSSIGIQTDENINTISVAGDEKSNHYFDLPALLTFSFGKKSSWCDIYCVSEAEINIDKSESTIVLEENSFQYDKRHCFKAVFFKSDDAQIMKTNYISTNTNIVKRKHILYNLLVTSLLPLLLLNIILFCIYQSVGCLFAGVFCFFVFTLPALIDIVKFNKICDDDSILKGL